MEHGAELGLVVGVLQTGDGAESGVVHDHPGAGDTLLHGGSHAGGVDAEAAVAGEGQHDLIGGSQLAAQDGGSAEAHGGQTGGVVDGARNGDVELLGHAVLVPAHIGEDDGVLGDDLLHVLQDALGSHGEAAVVGDGLVAGLERGLGGSDLLTQLGVALTLGADLLHFLQDLGQADLQVADGADLHSVVAADLVGVDVDLQEGGLIGIEGDALIPAGAVGLAEAGAQAQDHVGIGGQGVGELQAPEAGLADHQGVLVGQAALAGQSAGHREIQELGQSGQLLGGLSQQDAAAGVEDGVLGLHQLLGDGLGGSGVQGGLQGLVAVLVGAGPQLLVHLTGEHVHGHVHQDGAGTAGLSQTERLVQDVGQGLHIVHAPAALAHGLEHAVLVAVLMHLDLLMGVTAEVVAGHIARDDHHGDGVQGGVGHAGEHVGQAGAQVAHDHGGLVGDAGVAVSRGGSHGLMPGADVLDLLAAGKGVQHADDGVAAQSEQLGDAPALQVVHQQVRYQFLAHV